MDTETLVWSALVSAVVGGLVATAASLALGGPVEVRRQRAIDRYRVLTELEGHVRVVLNAVRMLIAMNSSWSAVGSTLAAWPNEAEFDAAFDEGLQSYLAARPHLSGTTESSLEHTAGETILAAGSCMTRVRTFRIEAVGKDSSVFQTHQSDMQLDLRDAEALLQRAARCLRSQVIAQTFRHRALKHELQSLRALGDKGQFPRTPMSYASAVRKLRESAPSE